MAQGVRGDEEAGAAGRVRRRQTQAVQVRHQCCHLVSEPSAVSPGGLWNGGSEVLEGFLFRVG
jgi:hypothetical protein